MKNRVLLEYYYLPGELKTRIGESIDYYNTQQFHESLTNLTPEDVFTGRRKGHCSIDGCASSRKHWPSGVGYTTNRRPHNYEPDD